jgi:hypothetical protein
MLANSALAVQDFWLVRIFQKDNGISHVQGVLPVFIKLVLQRMEKPYSGIIQQAMG